MANSGEAVALIWELEGTSPIHPFTGRTARCGRYCRAGSPS